MHDLRRPLAEAIGTFLLVCVGPGAAAVNAWTGGVVTHVGISLAFGCVILAMVYAVGHVSGAHLNPAVTIAFWIARRFPGRSVGPYVIAQLLGASGAGWLIHLALGKAASAAATVPAIPIGAAIGVEVVLTFMLMLAIMAVATDARVTGGVAGLAVGTTIAAAALVGGPLTGASLNPARSFGPALATGRWTDHWIYWVAPVIGATIAAWLYEYLREGTAHDHRIKHSQDPNAASRALSLHRQFRAESNGGSAAQSQREGPLSR